MCARERAEKRWGEDDPEFGAQVEGLIAGEEVDLDYEMTRQKGEALGEYAIVPQGEEIQGNYELIFEPGVLEIVPQDIGAAALEWFGEAPVLARRTAACSNQTQVTGRSGSGSGRGHVRAEGMGNFTGQAEWDCAPGPLEPELVLTDEAGVELTTLRTDAAGELNALGRVALNAPVRPERLRVWINGEILDEMLTPDGEGLCRFELTASRLSPRKRSKLR